MVKVDIGDVKGVAAMHFGRSAWPLLKHASAGRLRQNVPLPGERTLGCLDLRIETSQHALAHPRGTCHVNEEATKHHFAKLAIRLYSTREEYRKQNGI